MTQFNTETNRQSVSAKKQKKEEAATGKEEQLRLVVFTVNETTAPSAGLEQH